MITNIAVGAAGAGSLAWYVLRVIHVHRKPLQPPAPYFMLREGQFLEAGEWVTYVAGRRVRTLNAKRLPPHLPGQG